MSGLLMVPDQSCDRCHEPRLLLARTAWGHLCAGCYYAMGQPPAQPDTPEERQAALDAARKVMTKRRGNDGYRVRAGKA